MRHDQLLPARDDSASIIAPYNVAESTALDQANDYARVRNRRRPDSLSSLAVENALKDISRFDSIREILCLIRWIDLIVVKVSSDYVLSETPYIDHYLSMSAGSLGTDLGDLIEQASDLYSWRMKNRILTSVQWSDAVGHFVDLEDDDEPDFYICKHSGEILRVHSTMYEDYRRMKKSADNDPDMEIPEPYRWCDSKSSFLEELNADFERAKYRLDRILTITLELSMAIENAAQLSHLPAAALRLFRFKMQFADITYTEACAVLYGNDELRTGLINYHSEQWWNIRRDDSSSERRSGPQNTHNDTAKDTTVSLAFAETTLDKSRRSSLNFIVPVVSVVSAVTAGLSLAYGEPKRGTIHDSNFWQTITSSLFQLLSVVTVIWPTLNHPRLSRLSWMWIWICAGCSVVCAVLSVPLYLVLPTGWSTGFAFAGAVAQAIVELQFVNAI